MIYHKYIYFVLLMVLFGNNSFAQSPCSTTSNVALNKTATQVSTNPSFATADLAVDGNVNGSLYGGNSVSQTAWENNGWWEVECIANVDNISNNNID